MQAYPWREVEIRLTAERDYPNPYTNIDFWAEFTHSSGVLLRRLAFWDGGRGWRIRFASPLADRRWAWRSFSTIEDPGLTRQIGELICAPILEGSARFE